MRTRKEGGREEEREEEGGRGATCVGVYKNEKCLHEFSVCTYMYSVCTVFLLPLSEISPPAVL